MDLADHTLATLFEQLGLENSEEQIANFVELHRPLPNSIALEDASFWNEAQAQFLREAISQDADWAEAVDTLNALLQ